MRRLLAHEQSPWYDNIRRSMTASGELARMVEEDGLRGVDHDTDVVPGTSYTFGAVEAAQTRGHLSVLEQRGRRAMRLHFEEAEARLEVLRRAIEEGL